MTAEDWLREHGIEIKRPPGSSEPGQQARYPTSALPSPPSDAVEDQETQAVPSVVRLNLHIRGDITEWPTSKLDDEAVTVEVLEISAVDALPLAPSDPPPDFTLADEMTMPMPIIMPDDITTTPTRRLDAEEA